MPEHDPLDLQAAPLQGLDRLGLEFLKDYLGTALRHHPEDLDLMAELAHVHTRLGEVREGLAIDRRLARLLPDCPTVHYNLACSLALCGDTTGALDSLETAARLGYSDGEHLAADEDLRSLRSEPRFRALLASLSAHEEG
jgi:Flp pilus assembly protein TadD